MLALENSYATDLDDEFWISWQGADDRTVEFCGEFDQTAFDASYTSNPLEHYEPLVRQILRGA